MKVLFFLCLFIISCKSNVDVSLNNISSLTPELKLKYKTLSKNIAFDKYPSGIVTEQPSIDLRANVSAEYIGYKVYVYTDSACTDLIYSGNITGTNNNFVIPISTHEYTTTHLYYKFTNIDSINSSCLDSEQSVTYYPSKQIIPSVISGMAIDFDINVAYILDPYFSEALFRVDLSTGLKTKVLVASIGDFSDVSKDITFDYAFNLLLDSSRRYLYLANSVGQLLKIDIQNNYSVQIISSSLVGSGSTWTYPQVSIFNTAQDKILIGEYFSIYDSITEVNLTTGDRDVIISPILGSGDTIGKAMAFCMTSDESTLYYYDSTLNGVSKVDMSTGVRSTVANSSGSYGTGVDMIYTQGMVLSHDESKLYLSDDYEGIIELDISTGNRTVISPLDYNTTTSSVHSGKIILHPTDEKLYISSYSSSYIQEVDISTGTRTNLVNFEGTGIPLLDIDFSAMDNNGNIYILSSLVQGLIKINVDKVKSYVTASNKVSVGSGPIMNAPRKLAVSRDGSFSYISDMNNDAIYKVDNSTGTRSVVASDSRGSGPSIEGDAYIAVNSTDTTLYVAESTLDYISSVEVSSGNSTIIASSSIGSGAVFDSPSNIVINSSDSFLYYYDTAGIMRLEIATGTRSIIASSSVGSGYEFSGYNGLAINHASDKLYAIQTGYYEPSILVEIDLISGLRKVVSASDNTVGVGPAFYSNAYGLTVSADDTDIFITDRKQRAIIKVNLMTGNRTIYSR